MVKIYMYGADEFLGHDISSMMSGRLAKIYQIKEEERESSPVKEGDIFVLEDEDLKSYNVCFFVEQVYEGYYAGTMYSLTGGKKRKCDLISITVLYRKGINYAGLYEFRDISFTDEEIKRVGFKRV